MKLDLHVSILLERTFNEKADHIVFVKLGEEAYICGNFI